LLPLITKSLISLTWWLISKEFLLLTSSLKIEEKFLLLIVLSTSLETILSLLSLQKFLEGLSVLILFLLRFSEILLILFLFPKLLRIISTINAI